MSKKVARSVNVFHEGRFYSFEPGDTVPDDVAEAITNPKVFEPRVLPGEEEDVEVQGNVVVDEENFGEVGTAGSDEDDLESLTVEQLREVAENEGVDLSGLSRKAEIIEAINAAR